MKSLILTEHLQIAVINGQKTQTRRPLNKKDLVPHLLVDEKVREFTAKAHAQYKKGEIIYLREWFRVHSDLDEVPPRNIIAGSVEYKLGGAINCIGDHIQSPGRWRWHQTMPAHLARTFLKVTDVRVVQLNEISNEDALAEGINAEYSPSGMKYWDYQEERFQPMFRGAESFQSLWKSIYGEDAWKENPWVYAYTFQLCDKEGKELSA
ncbi:hypothetical protein [Carboxylicivirga marina]|uniref:hypothetical protein n=1 Tax=Carboxylicivirga marina TaxID=2800988 RepID=UPI002596AA74|nr:hypothetical protein [uncultured Carboxylicivirga sp.]